MKISTHFIVSQYFIAHIDREFINKYTGASMASRGSSKGGRASSEGDSDGGSNSSPFRHPHRLPPHASRNRKVERLPPRTPASF